MKKTLVSLSMIAIVTVIGVGATGAFFSDSETSTGNTFTAGAIDLTVDSEQHYNGNECIQNVSTTTPGYVWAGQSAYPVPGTPCDGTWAATSLGAQKFFNFLDVKPGDEGENTVSLHVDSNDAFACADITVTKNDDNTTVDPEVDVGDPNIDVPGTNLFDGELAQNINFFAWADDGAVDGFQGTTTDSTEGDNIWQAGELPLFSNIIGPASDAIGGKSYTLADSTTGPLTGGSTSYIGLAWCAGTLTTSGPGVLTCDGSGMGNVTQTDSMVADIAFRVEQARNNPDFKCTVPEVVERATVGALLTAYTAPVALSCDITVDDSFSVDTSTTTNTIQEGVNLATAGQTVCVSAGTYTEDVNVNKSITLAGAGPTLVTLTGVSTGEAGALVVSADNVNVKGFKVIGTGVSALRISGARNLDTFSYNHAVAATGKNAFLTDGGQSNHTISNNLFEGAASQLVYVNGNVDVALPSTNVDFTSNTFGGTATGPLLGMSANGSSITLNKFSGVTSYTSVESFEGNNLVNQNNFNVDLAVGPIHVVNAVLGGTQFPGTLNAENNWWGDVTPADNVTGLVDTAPSEVSALPQN